MPLPQAQTLRERALSPVLGISYGYISVVVEKSGASAPLTFFSLTSVESGAIARRGDFSGQPHRNEPLARPWFLSILTPNKALGEQGKSSTNLAKLPLPKHLTDWREHRELRRKRRCPPRAQQPPGASKWDQSPSPARQFLAQTSQPLMKSQLEKNTTKANHS